MTEIRTKLEEILSKDVIKRSDLKNLLNFIISKEEDSEKEVVVLKEKYPEKKGFKSISTAIYVDGGQGSYSGEESWARVTDSSGKDILPHYEHLYKDFEYKDVKLPCGKTRVLVAKFNDVKTKHVNGAELIALLVGLRISCNENEYIKECSRKGIECWRDPYKNIFSDSQVALSWSNGRLGEETRKKMDPRKIKYISETIELKNKFESQNGSVLKISGDENKADFGFHIKFGMRPNHSETESDDSV